MEFPKIMKKNHPLTSQSELIVETIIFQPNPTQKQLNNAKF